jgi:hypothetical protein
MGLYIDSDIKSEKYGGCGRIHILRRWILEHVEYENRNWIERLDYSKKLLNDDGDATIGMVAKYFAETQTKLNEIIDRLNDQE